MTTEPTVQKQNSLLNLSEEYKELNKSIKWPAKMNFIQKAYTLATFLFMGLSSAFGK